MVYSQCISITEWLFTCKTIYIKNIQQSIIAQITKVKNNVNPITLQIGIVHYF